MKRYLIIMIGLYILNGCDSPRDLITSTHLTRVPKPYNLSAEVDSTVTKKILVILSWLCDDNGNIRNYEVSRATLRGEGDTSQYYPVPPSVTVRTFSDSTVPKPNIDSVEYFYRVTVSGIDKFLGPSSNSLSVKIYKKQ